MDQLKHTKKMTKPSWDAINYGKVLLQSEAVATLRTVKLTLRRWGPQSGGDETPALTLSGWILHRVRTRMLSEKHPAILG